MWIRIAALIYKEILAVWRDKKSRTVLVVPPLVQLVIFTWAATLDVQNVTIGILNRDSGEKAFELVQRFHGSPTFSEIIYLQSVPEIAPFIDNQQGAMVVFIDEQFSRNIDAKKPADIQLILDGRKTNTTQILAGYASSIIEQFNQDIAPELPFQLQNTQIVPRNWFNPNLYYYWYNIPNLSGVLTMVVGMVVTSLTVAREREVGTFDQLLVSPILPFEIMIGKAVPAFIIGMAEGTLIVIIGVFGFGVPFTGSILLLYLTMFFFIGAIVGVGLFISSLCYTQQQAILSSFVFISPAISLSGFATPIENMPQWLQVFTYANPLRYYIVNAKGLFLKAMPAGDVFANIWPLVIIAAFTLTGATLFFRGRLQ